ncbi:MAG TPA: DUF3365 domain-containing protein [Longimicrobiales bacterium]|nr:DUF3365 domain-containing protein [Longimicrobiales bacterium]
MAVDAEPAIDRATAAAADFSGRLRTALQARMKSEGPVGAVDFCHAQAPRIADAVMAEHGVRLGRVAVPGRNRNPDNAPTDWQRQALTRFQSQVGAGAAAGELLFVQQESLPPGVALRMMRGIAVEPTCLACHGRTISAPVAQVINDRYPDDAATGFDVGDLRGGLWVQVPDSPDRESGP